MKNLHILNKIAKVQKNIQGCWIVWVIAMGLWNSLFAQENTHIQDGLLAELHQVITPLGDSLDVPFVYEEDAANHAFELHWHLDCTPPDTVYLCVVGIAWKASFILNERFMAATNRPLEPWVIPISNQWLKEGQNVLRFTLDISGTFPNYPHAFTGLLEPIRIFEKNPEAGFAVPHQKMEKQDTVLVWAPYYKGKGFAYSDSLAIQDLYHIVLSGIRTVYFPFPPSPRLQKLARAHELILVDSIPAGARIGMLNPYPYEALNFQLPAYFWLDENGHRTAFYGSYYPLRNTYASSYALRPGIGMVCILLFPLLALLGVKYTNPTFFFALNRIFSKPDRYIDSLNETTSGNGGFALIVTLINLLGYTLVVFLIVYYVHLTRSWERLSIFSDTNLFIRLFYPIDSISSLFWQVLLLVGAWFLGKYLSLMLLQNIFSVRNLTSGSVNLDIIGNFPYSIMLIVPLFLSFFSPSYHRFFMGLFIFLLVVIFLRKIITNFYGLERLFNFSLGVKILYICAFNIIPYIIWF